MPGRSHGSLSGSGTGARCGTVFGSVSISGAGGASVGVVVGSSVGAAAIDGRAGNDNSPKDTGTISFTIGPRLIILSYGSKIRGQLLGAKLLTTYWSQRASIRSSIVTTSRYTPPTADDARSIGIVLPSGRYSIISAPEIKGVPACREKRRVYCNSSVGKSLNSTAFLDCANRFLISRK